VSSLSHFNIDNVRKTKDGKSCREVDQDGKKVWVDQDNKEVDMAQTEVITDDLDTIIDMIRETVSDFQWVFFGYAPPKLKDLLEKRKIEYHPGVPILNYPSIMENLNLQAIVAPIKDMEFNRCKSHINYLECCAAGIPLFASNYLPYSNVMKRDFLFDDQNELKDKLLKLKFSSNGVYKSIIESNWKIFNSPKRDGDFNVKNWWLEDNLGIWVDLFRLKQKAPLCSMKLFLEAKHKK
jgi:hypothetical protein